MSVWFPQRTEPWTVDDLPDEGYFEIVDGALVVSPPPTPRHNAITSALHFMLAGIRGPRHVFGTGGIEFGKVNHRVPDVLVLRPQTDPPSMTEIRPDDVLLVVEVASPSSVSTDHVAKRDQYARAGIPAYWIVESEPELRLTALALPVEGAPYVEVGVWREGDRVALESPFPVSFAIADLRG